MGVLLNGTLLLGYNPVLKALVQNYPSVRLPMGWDDDDTNYRRRVGILMGPINEASRVLAKMHSKRYDQFSAPPGVRRQDIERFPLEINLFFNETVKRYNQNAKGSGRQFYHDKKNVPRKSNLWGFCMIGCVKTDVRGMSPFRVITYHPTDRGPYEKESFIWNRGQTVFYR